MGLDIYAGTLTQYYSDNWVSSIQKFAEESGMTYKKVTPDSDLNPSIFHKFYQWITKSSKNKQVNEATKLWRDNLIKALSKTDNKVTTREETDKKEYFTERIEHETPSIYHTESLAKYAFSIFYQMALFSQKTKVPIVMDY